MAVPSSPNVAPLTPQVRFAPRWNVARAGRAAAVTARGPNLLVPSEGERMFVHAVSPEPPPTRRPRRDVRRRLAGFKVRRCSPDRPQPRCRSGRRARRADRQGPGEEQRAVRRRSLRSRPRYEWRQPKLERGGKHFDPTPLRLPVRLVDRWSKVVHPLAGSRRQARHRLGGPKYAEYEISLRWRGPRGVVEPPTMPVPERGERRSRRNGRDCKSAWLRLSGFESHLPHRRADPGHLRRGPVEVLRPSRRSPRPSDHDSDRAVHSGRVEPGRSLRDRGGERPGACDWNASMRPNRETPA